MADKRTDGVRGVGRYYDGEGDVIPSSSSSATDFDSRSEHPRSDEMGRELGISGSTIERVRSIMEYGTPKQLQTMTQERSSPVRR